MNDQEAGHTLAVAFVASHAFVEALDGAAARQGETRSHLARRIVADYLRATGALAPEAPLTRHSAARISRRAAA